MSDLGYVFPLAILREALKLAAKGYTCPDNHKLPPLAINAPAPAFVSCGSEPLSRVVNVSGRGRFTSGLTCYINVAGEQVFPA